MKKVHLWGVVGLAPAAAVGLAVPAANAATAATHTPKKPVKAVSLKRANAPLVTCGFSHHKSGAWNSHNVRMSGGIQWGGTLCVKVQWLHLQSRRAGLTERVRYYSGGGALEHTAWVGGTLIFSTASFLSNPSIYAHEVCQALVLNTNHNTVKFGPHCWTT